MIARRVAVPRALGWHLTLRMADGRGIARDPAGLRLAARMLHRHGERFGLLAFRVADTHTHALLACPRADAGRFAQAVSIALGRALSLAVAFEPYRATPIVDERHLKNALRYLFLQEEHHGTAFDLAHDGSSLVDLLGLRALTGGGMSERLARHLPRLRRSELVDWLRAGEIDASPIDAAIGRSLLAEAAAAALGLPDLRGRTDEQAHARTAAAHAARRLGWSAAVTGRALGIAKRSVRRSLTREPAPALLRALELQLRLRSLLRVRARRGFSAVVADEDERRAAKRRRSKRRAPPVVGRVVELQKLNDRNLGVDVRGQARDVGRRADALGAARA